MQTLMIPILVLALGQEPNQAEKTFRASAKKLAEAETVRINVSGVMKDEKEQLTLKGVVLMAKGNKTRIDLVGEGKGMQFKFASVSDGAKMSVTVTEGDKPAKASVSDAPPNGNTMLAGVTSRAGLLAGLFMVVRVGGPGEKAAELDDMIAVSDFTLGKAEKIGDRPAQRIDYKLTILAGLKKEVLDAKVWLDSETNLPLKRELVKQEGKKIQVTETYDILLGGKINAKTFELPKWSISQITSWLG